MASGSLKAILYALGANTGIAIAKTIAAVATHSGSMIAEAIHSYADCANQGLLRLGMKQAKRPQTDDHPLGRVAIFILVETKSMMVGESVSPELRHEIETFVAAQAEVEKVFRVITLAWGEQMVIAVKAKMKSGYTADEIVDAINVVEARMQEK